MEKLKINGQALGEPDYQGTTGINQYDHFLETVRKAMQTADMDGDGEEIRRSNIELTSKEYILN